MASIYDNSSTGTLPFLNTGLYPPTQTQDPSVLNSNSMPLNSFGSGFTPSWGNNFEQFNLATPANPGYDTPFDLAAYQASNQQPSTTPNQDLPGGGGPVRAGGSTPTFPGPQTGGTPQPSAFGSALGQSLNQIQQIQSQLQNSPLQQNQVAGQTNPNQTTQQNSWMDSNSSGWGDDLMKFMMTGGGSQMNFDPMNIQWQNFNNGATENITRALGVLQQGGGDALAKLLGGKLEASPFATFGTQQRDQYIRMPNGQMIDASAMANSLKGAMGSSNPFSSLSDVIGLYQRENQAFNPATNTDAINLAQPGGSLDPRQPPGWNPSSFAGGNPTYTPSGPVPGNPSNPGMGTSNPIQFQGGQIQAVNGANGFPIFNYSQPQTSLPNNGGVYQQPQTQQPGTGGTNTPQQPTNNVPPAPGQSAPQGVNSNWQYYMNTSPRNNLFSSQGLYGQPGGAGGGGGSTQGIAGTGSGNTGTNNNTSPFQTPKPSSTAQSAGSMPNGAQVVGG